MAQMLGSIVAAVDFSEASARAVRVAGRLAARFGASLRLVHAETIEAPPYFTGEQLGALEAQRQQTRAQAERYLADFGRRETEVPFEAVISTRQPVEAILRESEGADLVVMGTHGRRGPARWWLGSVAERVLRETHRPLMVVRAGEGPGQSLLDQVEVHVPEGDGARVRDWARRLGQAGSGRVVAVAPDRSQIEPGTTLLVMAVPEPRTSHWLSRHAESWLRASPVPVVFVSE